ncbi:MAG: hypothetical protein ABIL45_04205 [candidate division WOR-3 bacterium]
MKYVMDVIRDIYQKVMLYLEDKQKEGIVIKDVIPFSFAIQVKFGLERVIYELYPQYSDRAFEWFRGQLLSWIALIVEDTKYIDKIFEDIDNIMVEEIKNINPEELEKIKEEFQKREKHKGEDGDELLNV